MTTAGRDLLHALHVKPEPSPRDTVATAAHRIDIGWGAWCFHPSLSAARRRDKVRFWLALWSHFGQAQFLVQIDDSYHTATTVRLRQSEDRQRIDVLLVQTSSPVESLFGLLLIKLRRPISWRKVVHGRTVVISRYPQHLSQAVLPPLWSERFTPCHEVLLDRQTAAKLPLRITLD